MNKKLIAISLGAVAALVVSAPKAHANAELELISGSTISTVVVSDAVAATTGASFNGSVGGWNINITTGITDGKAPAAPYVNLNSISTSTAGTTAGLEIVWSAQGFTLSPGSALSTLSGTSQQGSGSAAGAAITLDTYYAGNNALDLGNTANNSLSGGTLMSSLTSTPGAAGLLPTRTGTDGIPSVGNYSLTAEMIIPALGSGTEQHVDVNGTISVVPDGGMTLTMLGSALVGLTGIRSRFSRKSA